jgi:hypothetical protein
MEAEDRLRGILIKMMMQADMEAVQGRRTPFPAWLRPAAEFHESPDAAIAVPAYSHE